MPKKSVSIDPLEASLLKGLTQPNAYPHDPSAVQGVEEIQTHISYVFLTRDRVYKFRKAVNLEFLDFRTRAQRSEDCLREVHLNRRLAPDVYLGLAEASNKKGRVRVGAISEHLGTSSEVRAEPCVVMRRLPEERDTLSLLRQGKLRAAHVLRMAERIAEFHARHRIEVPDSGSDEEWISKLAAPARACLEHLKKCPPSLVPAKPLADIDLHMEAVLDEHSGAFISRREHGDFVDGHGDLHLDHCWFEEDDAEPLFIDCIEFRDDFRRIDPASEVAFPFMDFALFRVLDFYITYRALVRSKVAAISACAPELSTQQRKDAAGSLKRHLLLARRTLSRRDTPGLVLVSGIVGSGKSTVAEAVAESLHGVVVSSDIVRKHLAGIGLQDRKPTGWRTGCHLRNASTSTGRCRLGRWQKHSRFLHRSALFRSRKLAPPGTTPAKKPRPIGCRARDLCKKQIGLRSPLGSRRPIFSHHSWRRHRLFGLAQATSITTAPAIPPILISSAGPSCLASTHPP
jgi:aminoglycoside phosphotransferase family enzyme